MKFYLCNGVSDCMITSRTLKAPSIQSCDHGSYVIIYKIISVHDIAVNWYHRDLNNHFKTQPWNTYVKQSGK